MTNSVWTINGWNPATSVVTVTNGSTTLEITAPADLLSDKDALLSYIREQTDRADSALSDPSHLIGMEL